MSRYYLQYLNILRSPSVDTQSHTLVVIMAVEYSKKTNAELIEILKSRGLSHTGKKADMVARLQEADKAAAAAAPAPAPAPPAAEDVIDWDDDTETAPAATKPAPAAPAAAPEQKTVTEPATAQKAKAAKPEEKTEAATATTTTTTSAGAAGTGAAEAKPVDEQHATNGTDKKAATEEKKGTEKPAVDYSRGLATTDPDAELAKRKARAAKFGAVEESVATEAEKALARVKRFGPVSDEPAKIKGLDEALPTRKRGRGDDGDSGRGKRRHFHGRGRGRGPRRGGRNEAGNSNNNSSKEKFSEADRVAMEKRKERFAAK